MSESRTWRRVFMAALVSTAAVLVTLALLLANPPQPEEAGGAVSSGRDRVRRDAQPAPAPGTEPQPGGQQDSPPSTYTYYRKLSNYELTNELSRGPEEITLRRPSPESLEDRLAAMEALAAAHPEEPDKLAELASLRRQMGDEMRSRGDVHSALEWYRAALKIHESCARLLASVRRVDEASSENLQKLARALVNLGGIHEAVRCHELLLAGHRRAVARAPGEGGAVRGLAQALAAAGWQRIKSGDSTGALADQREALAIWEEVVARAPRDRYARSHVRHVMGAKGYALIRQGRLDAAVETQRTVVGLARALLAGRPRATYEQGGLAGSLENQAWILLEQGRLDTALALLREAMDAAVKAANAGDSWYRRQVAVIHNRIGDVHRARGELEAALTRYRAAFEIARGLLKSYPDAAWRINDLSYDQRQIGGILLRQGKAAEAAESLSRAYEMDLGVTRITPDIPDHEWYLGASQCDLGDLAMSRGFPEEASTWFDAALATRTWLVQQDAANLCWRYELTVTRERIGDVLLVRGEKTDALALFRAIRDERAGLWSREPSSARSQHGLAFAHEKVARILLGEGDREAGVVELEAAADILRALVERAPHHRADLKRVEKQLTTTRPPK